MSSTESKGMQESEPREQPLATDEAPRLSAELFVIPVDGKYLVYAPLRQAAFLTNKSVVNIIADLKDGISINPNNEHQELVRFLRRIEILDGGEENQPITTFQGQPNPTSITLFLTTACNLRCTYCYAAAGDTPIHAMQPEIAKRGIDFILQNAQKLKQPGIEIAYHGGGEPTVNWRTLTESYHYACEHAAAAGLTVSAALATNGVMSDEKVDWIIKHLDGVSLSFDGLPEVHDAHRLTIAGQGSSDGVIRTIRRFDDADYSYGLRLTVTQEHISQIESSVRYICENFNPQRIQVEPAYQLGRWSDAPSAETQEFISGFRAAQKTAQTFGKEIEFSGARVGMLSNHFCGISQDSFALTARGQVSACYETFIDENEWSQTFFYGRYESKQSEFTFDLPILNHLREQSVEHRDFCRSCFAKWTCGGDCYHKSLTVNGPGEFSGTDRCHIIRELTMDQILDRIESSGGIFWHGDLPESGSARGKEVIL